MSPVMTRLRACLFLLTALVLAGPASAHSYKAGPIEIDHPWVRETPPSATVGAGYFKVNNTGSETDKLVGVETAAAVKVEIHESLDADGVAKMRQVKTIELPPGMTEFKPGGYHLMLIGLKEPLAEGMRIPATLVFEKAGRADVELAVESMSYGGPAHNDHGDHKH